MEVVRKRLTQTEIQPANIRYNSGTDTVQFSPDNGANWYDTPEADPRHSDAFRLPALSGGDPQCDAAANMVKWIKDFLDQATALLGEGAGVLTIVNTAIPIYELISGGSLTLLALLTGVAETLFSIGYTALLAAMDSTAYDALLCAFFCNLPSDGQVSAALLAEIESDITDTLNTTAGIIVNALLFLQGEVGLSNAGAIGSESGDCSGCDCGWCYTWDGANSPAWTFFTDANYSGGHRGAFSSPNFVATAGGTGNPNSTEILAAIVLSMPATIRRIAVTFSRTPGSFSVNGGQQDAMIFDSGNGYYNGTTLEHRASNTTESNFTWVWTGTQVVASNISLWMFASETLGAPSGFITISKIVIEGSGDPSDNPFGTDNC